MKPKIRNEKRRQWLMRRSRAGKQVARSERPRVVVFRSAKHIYAQLIEAGTGKTLTTVSSRNKQLLGDLAGRGNVEAAKRVGAALAEAARERQIDEVVFNRNGFLYHGRVKALAEAAREAGLRF